jgi:hypothetical protein
MCQHHFSPNLKGGHDDVSVNPASPDSRPSSPAPSERGGERSECGDQQQTPRIVIQLGANWIHNCDLSKNPMFSLATKLGIKLHETSPDEEPGLDVCLYDTRGHARDDQGFFAPVPPEEYAGLLERWRWVREHVEDIAAASPSLLGTDGGVGGDCLLELFKEAVRLSESPDLPFGPCSDLCRRGLNWCFDRLSIDYAMPLQYVSWRDYCGQESTALYGEGLVQGGYFQLLEHLAAEFPLDIRLQTIVESITSDPTSGQVTVVCRDGSVFETDACLVTLPVGVLKSGQVKFSPVPREVRELTEELQPGLMNLVWLWYPSMFWPDNGTNFFGVARDEEEAATFTTFLAPPMFDQNGERQPILMCQTFGEFAHRIEAMSNEEIAAQATSVLRKMFGDDVVPDPIGCVHSSWNSDPYSKCSWATAVAKPLRQQLHPSSSPSSSFDMIAGEGQLQQHCSGQLPLLEQQRRFHSLTPGVFFAGEATGEEFRGTVHAAFLSGIREAGKIMEYLD